MSSSQNIEVNQCIYFSTVLEAQTDLGHAELLYTAPMGVLAAKLLGPAARIEQIHLEYLQPAQAGDRLTFSARVTDIDPDQNQARLNYLVLQGPRVCARGMVHVRVDQ